MKFSAIAVNALCFASFAAMGDDTAKPRSNSRLRRESPPPSRSLLVGSTIYEDYGAGKEEKKGDKEKSEDKCPKESDGKDQCVLIETVTKVESRCCGDECSSKTSSVTKVVTSPTDPPPTTPSVCAFPSPVVPDNYENFVNVSNCDDINEILSVNNTFIQLQAAINCSSGGREQFFRVIIGDSNTVDCGGFPVENTGGLGSGFEFQGRNNILQNCPLITGFVEKSAIRVATGSFYASNITVTENGTGLGVSLAAQAYVADSEFSNNTRSGIQAVGNDDNPYRITVKSSSSTQNGIGMQLIGLGVTCLEGNDMSQNVDENVEIGALATPTSGTPFVTLKGINACNGENADIEDNSGVTTVLDNVQCETVTGTAGGTAEEYGCLPCP